MWPDVVIFWGAGATSYLGFPTTKEQGEIIRKLASNERLSNNDISDIFFNIKEPLMNLLIALGHNSNSTLGEINEEELNCFLKFLKKGNKFKELRKEGIRDRLIWLRRYYDWDALKNIINICPEENFLQNLFNIIDLNLSKGTGMYVPDKRRGNVFLNIDRLKGSRNCLIFLIQLMISSTYERIVREKRQELEPYIKFAEALARLMVEEAKEKSLRTELNKRDFYLFSYAIISMNFDPILFWLLLNAHKKVNDRESTRLFSCPLKLFLDVGNVIANYSIRKNPKEDDFQFSFHESVAQRINDKKYKLNRIVRVGKFYFPHGSSIIRECPNCGKYFMLLGEEWSYYSNTLFPVNIIPYLRRIPPISEKEKDEIEHKYKTDSITCPYCGSLTETSNSVMVMQTLFKQNLPLFVEEVQKEIKVCLENAKHIVLLGYSFPIDDVVWETTLLSKKSSKKDTYCSVVVGFKGEKRWLEGKELENFVKIHKGKEEYGTPTIEKMMRIFGKNNVRAYTGGIPNVWSKGDTYGNVINLLYPKFIR